MNNYKVYPHKDGNEYWIIAKKTIIVPGTFFWSKATKKLIEKEYKVPRESYENLVNSGVTNYKGYTISGRIKNTAVEALLKDLT